MTPPGQNYPIHKHTFLFWGLYLGVAIVLTTALLGLFLYMVYRNGQATLSVPTAAPEPEATPIEAPGPADERGWRRALHHRTHPAHPA